MKRYISFLTVLMLTCSLSQTLSASVFGTAGTLRPGHLSLGLEPQIFFSPSTFMFWLHGGIGLTRSIDMDLKLGMGNNTVFGADVEFMLVPDTRRTLGVSFATGVHGSSNLGLDATLLISNNFRTFTLYGALDADIEFVEINNENEIWLPMYATIGVAIPFARRAEFLLEGNIAVTDSASSNLAGGVAFYF
ncbi:hypothetical protein K8S19_00860 [bacterium]|nr:hypothetical protein [bacterium]